VSGLDLLVDELLDTVNAPVAMESWAPPVRAFALHFFVRLVQPFEAPGIAVGALAEAWMLGADGFAADRCLLPEPGDIVPALAHSTQPWTPPPDHGAPPVGSSAHTARPDPDGFVRARAHRLVERLAESEERVRLAAARTVAVSWSRDRAARLNVRQEQVVAWLAAGQGLRAISFPEYVRLHAGRRAPSLRSLQRDWKALRDGGWLSPSSHDPASAEAVPDTPAFGHGGGERYVLATKCLEFGTQ
jgi:hypothetical protein